MSRREQLNRNPFLPLQNLSIFYDFKFDPIKAFLNNTQTLILKVEIDIKEKIEIWDQEKASDPEIPDGFDIYESEIITKGEFRPLLYNSMLLTIYSLFENELVRLCEYSAAIQSSRLLPKDLYGKNFIDQCQRYIENVLEVELAKLKTEWDEITKIQKLRNSFAHNNGILKEGNRDPTTIAFINNTNGLSLNGETFKIKIKNDEFLIYVIDKLVKYLDSVIDEIIKKKEIELGAV